MRYLELRSFDETPKVVNIIACFGRSDCAYYYVDSNGNVWGYFETMEESTEYLCELTELQEYGHYEKWAYLEDTFDIPFDYDEISDAEHEMLEIEEHNKMVDEYEKTMKNIDNQKQK